MVLSVVENTQTVGMSLSTECKAVEWHILTLLQLARSYLPEQWILSGTLATGYHWLLHRRMH